MMNIEWNVVTWYSKLLALIMFVALPFIGFFFGMRYEKMNNPEVNVITNEYCAATGTTSISEGGNSHIISSATFSCAENKTIRGIFFEGKAELTLSDSRHMLLPQAISASGARYANADESFIFWNKGDTAFVQEGEKITFKDCVTTPSLDSGVEGVITIGPTCPVMRVGDASCADKPYQTTVQIIKTGSPNSAPFATTESDAEGRYTIMLPPGNYALQPVGGRVMPRCETREVVVTSSIITNTDLSCDSGIR